MAEQVLDINKIMGLLPHRYPFLLIDKILEWESAKRIIGIKNVTINEPFFQGHFPGHPIMPGVLLIEAMAQTAGVLALMSTAEPEKKVLYFMGIDKAIFRKPVVPGDQVRFELDITKTRGNTLETVYIPAGLGNIQLEPHLVSRNNGLPEFCLVNAHEIEDLFFWFSIRHECQYAGRLCHGLDEQYTGHDRMAGEMSLEKRFVDGHIFNADDAFG